MLLSGIFMKSNIHAYSWDFVQDKIIEGNVKQSRTQTPCYIALFSYLITLDHGCHSTSIWITFFLFWSYCTKPLMIYTAPLVSFDLARNGITLWLFCVLWMDRNRFISSKSHQEWHTDFIEEFTSFLVGICFFLAFPTLNLHRQPLHRARKRCAGIVFPFFHNILKEGQLISMQICKVQFISWLLTPLTHGTSSAMTSPDPRVAVDMRNYDIWWKF